MSPSQVLNSLTLSFDHLGVAPKETYIFPGCFREWKVVKTTTLGKSKQVMYRVKRLQVKHIFKTKPCPTAFPFPLYLKCGAYRNFKVPTLPPSCTYGGVLHPTPSESLKQFSVKGIGPHEVVLVHHEVHVRVTPFTVTQACPFPQEAVLCQEFLENVKDSQR